jgi:hypothetical protein|tara:strand:- start:256 stop:516 length:261 start_codon:yes stop_codon:yes gene_type:complete
MARKKRKKKDMKKRKISKFKFPKYQIRFYTERFERKKKKKLTKDEKEYIKNISLTGYPFLDGILALAFVLFLIQIAPPYIHAFFGK